METKTPSNARSKTVAAFAFLFMGLAWAAILGAWFYIMSFMDTGNKGLTFALRLIASVQVFIIALRPAVILTTFIGALGSMIAQTLWKKEGK